jgi:ferrous iron transport protein B
MTRVADGAASLTALFPTVAAGFSFLLFNLLNAPCFAAIGAIRHEMKSARWTWFALGYLTAFAYAVSLMVYQLSRCFAGAGFTVWTGVALVLLALSIFLLLRRPRPYAPPAARPADKMA